MNSSWINQNSITPSIGANGANITMSIGEPSILPQYLIAGFLYLILSLVYTVSFCCIIVKSFSNSGKWFSIFCRNLLSKG